MTDGTAKLLYFSEILVPPCAPPHHPYAMVAGMMVVKIVPCGNDKDTTKRNHLAGLSRIANDINTQHYQLWRELGFPFTAEHSNPRAAVTKAWPLLIHTTRPTSESHTSTYCTPAAEASQARSTAEAGVERQSGGEGRVHKYILEMWKKHGTHTSLSKPKCCYLCLSGIKHMMREVIA